MVVHLVRSAAVCAIGLMANYRGEFGRAVFVFLTTQRDDVWARDALLARPFSLRAEDDLGTLDPEVKAVNDLLRATGATEDELLPADPASNAFTLGRVLKAMSIVDPACAFSVHAVRCRDAHTTVAGAGRVPLGDVHVPGAVASGQEIHVLQRSRKIEYLKIKISYTADAVASCVGVLCTMTERITNTSNSRGRL